MSQFHVFSVDGMLLTEADAQGCDWSVAEAIGWFTGGEARLGVLPRMQQDGDWSGRVYRAGRVITLRGDVRAPSATVLEAASRRLSAVLAGGGVGDLIGSSAAGELTSRVRLSAAPLFDPAGPRYATWQITVASDDPLLYGRPAYSVALLSSTGGGAGLQYPLTYPLDYGEVPGETPGEVVLANEGTAAYHPRLRIDGGVTDPVVSLVDTGDRLAISGSIAEGQWVDIDTRARTVLLNGTVSLRSRVTSTGSWLSVPPGGGTVRWSANAATPEARLSVWSYQSAWQ